MQSEVNETTEFLQGIAMWELQATEEYGRRLKQFAKKHRRELAAALDNLDTYHRTLQAGVKPLQVKFGFMHPEPLGVVAVDQKGGGKGLRETRLYVYPDAETETLHLITLGDKGTQERDIALCREFVLGLRKQKQDLQNNPQNNNERNEAAPEDRDPDSGRAG